MKCSKYFDNFCACSASAKKLSYNQTVDVTEILVIPTLGWKQVTDISGLHLVAKTRCRPIDGSEFFWFFWKLFFCFYMLYDLSNICWLLYGKLCTSGQPNFVCIQPMLLTGMKCFHITTCISFQNCLRMALRKEELFVRKVLVTVKSQERDNRWVDKRLSYHAVYIF